MLLDNDLSSILLDFMATYEETTSLTLDAHGNYSVPLLTISNWMLMQRKVSGGLVTFSRTWTKCRDGFGSAAGNDNYWLGLDKVYRLMQLGSVRLRVEVTEKMFLIKMSVASSCLLFV